MTDEELLTRYKKYKIKRHIFCIISVIIIIVILFFVFIKPTPSKNRKEKDTQPPIITLKQDVLEIMKGDEINYISYIDKVTDNSKENLLDKITYNKIDTNQIGEFMIVYKVSDSSGNEAQAKLKVKIDESEVQTEQDVIKEDNTVENNTSHPSSPYQTPESNNNIESDETNSSSNNSSQQEQKIIKYFLFKDGYTMQNVASACADELKSLGIAGMCSPIQDEDGIYLGMKLETN